jgi:chorismate mutase
MYCRGVRGATVADDNTASSILAATRVLLESLVEANDIDPADIASVFFTTSADLTAAFPAQAARDLGWVDVALMCAHEVDVPDGLPRCIRVLIHWNTDRGNSQIKHVYLGDAKALRLDRVFEDGR